MPRVAFFTSEEGARNPLYRRLGGTQGPAGQARKISLPPGFDPRIVQQVACRYTDCSIPAPFKERPVSTNDLFVFGVTTPQWARASSFTRFLDHTQRLTTVSRTPLEEWSARRRDLHLTTQTTLTTDRHPCLRWDLNPQSQQASGRRPMFRPCGHWDRQRFVRCRYFYKVS